MCCPPLCHSWLRPRFTQVSRKHPKMLCTGPGLVILTWLARASALGHGRRTGPGRSHISRGSVVTAPTGAKSSWAEVSYPPSGRIPRWNQMLLRLVKYRCKLDITSSTFYWAASSLKGNSSGIYISMCQITSKTNRSKTQFIVLLNNLPFGQSLVGTIHLCSTQDVSWTKAAESTSKKAPSHDWQIPLQVRLSAGAGYTP